MGIQDHEAENDSTSIEDAIEIVGIAKPINVQAQGKKDLEKMGTYEIYPVLDDEIVDDETL